MKKAAYNLKIVISTVFLTGLIVNLSYASSNWEDLLKGVKILKGSKIIDDGQWHEGLVYNAYVKFKFVNGNGNNRFENGEKVYLYVKGSNGQVYETPISGYTKEELKNWALARAKGLLDAIFSLDPLQATTGISSSVSEVQIISNNILSSSFNRPKSEYAKIRNKLTPNVNNKKKDKKEKYKELLLKTFTSEVKLDSEKGRVKNTLNNSRYSGDTQGSMFKWERYLFDNKSIGIMVSYKTIDMNDDWDSKTKTLSIIPSFKWIINFNKRFDLANVIYLRGSIIYLKSKLFPDGAGYITYGGGLAMQPILHVTDSSDLNFLVGYSISKRWIPESAVSDEVKFVADAINNLNPIQTVSLGASYKHNIMKNWFAELSFVHINIIKGEGIQDNRRKANYYVFRSYYKFWNKFKFGIGYKLVRNAGDYKEDAYMLTLGYNW